MVDWSIAHAMTNAWYWLLYNHVLKNLDTLLMVDFILPELNLDSCMYICNSENTIHFKLSDGLITN